MDATFEVKVVDPFVCEIEPTTGDRVPAGLKVPITWDTSWGAPDSCACRAKVYYRWRLAGASTWSDSILIADTTNTGGVEWDAPFATCTEAQVKVEFYDPVHQFLDGAWGGMFSIDPDTPQVAISQPFPGGFQACAGKDDIAVAWTATDLCTLLAHAVITLETGHGPAIDVSNTYPASGGIFLWPIPGTVRSTSNARIVVSVSDGAHTGADTSQAFTIVNPMQVSGGSDLVVGVPGEFFPVDVGVGNADFADLCLWGGLPAELVLVYRPGGPLPIGEWRDSTEIPIDPGGDTTDIAEPLLPGEPINLRFSFHAFDGVGIARGQVDTLFLAANALWLPPPAAAPGLEPLPGPATLRPLGAPPGFVAFATALDTVLVLDGGVAVGAEPPSTVIPVAVRLHPNVPNPFRETTEIRYALVEPCAIRLRVYDVAGRLVRRLAEAEPKSAGEHRIRWDGRDDQARRMKAGIYFCRLEAGHHRLTHRMLLLR
jgi:hypothetical protein